MEAIGLSNPETRGRFVSPIDGAAREVLYCDHMATGVPLRPIEDYLAREVVPFLANVHSLSFCARRCSAMVNEARAIVRAAVRASEDDAVIFCGHGATSAVNKLCRAIRPAIVICGPFEHHSNILPWRECGAEVFTARAGDDGRVDLAHLESLLSASSAMGKKPVVGAFTAASNVTGVLSDQNAITGILHRHGALAVWDFTAAAPCLDIDMHPVVAETASKDAVFFSGHKFLGGPGSPGVLVARKSLFEGRVPESPGGGTVFFVDRTAHVYHAQVEDREEGGSPDVLGIVRIGLAMKVKGEIGTAFIRARNSAIISRARAILDGLSPVLMFPKVEAGSSEGRLPTLTFVVWDKQLRRFLHHGFVVALLNDLFGIQSRAGCLCAGPFVWDLLGLGDAEVSRIEDSLVTTSRAIDELVERERDRAGLGAEVFRPGLVRISLHFTMTDEEVDFVARSIAFVAEHGSRLLGAYEVIRDTGEWRHRSWKGAADRNSCSLSSFSLAQATPTRLPLVPLSRAECMDHAMALVSRGLATGAPAVGQLFGELEVLRWFAVAQDTPCDSPARQPLFCVDRLAQRHGASQLSAAASTEIAESPLSELGEIDADACSGGAKPPTIHFADPPPVLRKAFLEAVELFGMIRDGDNVLVCVSGGKDSLGLLHLVKNFQDFSSHRKPPLRFRFGAATVDPQDSSFNPRPLIEYMAALGIPYRIDAQPLIASACRVQPDSICSFCSRIKRGLLYGLAREGGYNVIALGQHLDDAAESFVMSAFRNGFLRTMKAHYTIEKGDLRVIRPLIFTRERDLLKFSKDARLPVIWDNCPACFRAPTERHRIKQLLASQELVFPDLFHRLFPSLALIHASL